uniref:Dynein regulatory complex protein 1 n=1 Tax=Takifugu rubripes TaxID=31033 RepID=H2S295_TAKRU
MNRKSFHMVTKYATRINGQRSFESKQHSISQPSKALLNCSNLQRRQEKETGSSDKVRHRQQKGSSLVTDTQAAADAKEVQRRKELMDTQRKRLEQLENEAQSSQAKFEEISSSWSVPTENLTPQDLQAILASQKELCDEFLNDKKKLIKQLQKDLKVTDDHFVKDLRKQREDLDLMIERIQGQMTTLVNAYREELAQISVRRRMDPCPRVCIVLLISHCVIGYLPSADGAEEAFIPVQQRGQRDEEEQQHEVSPKSPAAPVSPVSFCPLTLLHSPRRSADMEAQKAAKVRSALEEELKQVFERASALDALIRKELGLAKEKPPVVRSAASQREKQGTKVHGLAPGASDGPTSEAEDEGQAALNKEIWLEAVSQLCDEAVRSPGTSPILAERKVVTSKCGYFIFGEVITRFFDLREKSAHLQPSSSHKDPTEDPGFWGTIGKAVPKEKLGFWDAAVKELTQYHATLTDIGVLLTETRSLERQNAELRTLLHESLTSQVGNKMG